MTLPIKTITSVLKVSTDIITNNFPIGFAAILAIMSVSTFKTDVIVFIGNVIRERPFNLKVGSYGFFLKKNILIPNVAEKNILMLVEWKKKFDSEFLSYNLMLNSGKKIALRATKKNKYSNSCVVRKKKFRTKQKTITPPCKLNGRSLMCLMSD